MIFTASTIDRILQQMEVAGVQLQVDWNYDWANNRRASRVWVACNGQRIELNPNSDWLDHLAYEIVTHPNVKHVASWHTSSYIWNH